MQLMGEGGAHAAVPPSFQSLCKVSSPLGHPEPALVRLVSGH